MNRDRIIYMAENANGKAMFACILYTLCSCSMTLTNKLLMSKSTFPYTMVVLFMQNCIGTALLKLFSMMGFIYIDPLETKKLKQWLPVNVFFVMMLGTGMMSFKYLSIPMITIFKNLANLLVVGGEWLLYGQPVSTGTLNSFGLMMVTPPPPQHTHTPSPLPSHHHFFSLISN